MTSPSASASPRMTGADRREQLLDVAKAIAVEHGFYAVSIEAVAREAGITRPVVYGHFRDLPRLLEALVERETTRALSQLAQLPAEDPGDERALLRRFEAYVRAAQADPSTWRLVLMPPDGAPASLRVQIERGRELMIAQLADAVRGGMDATRRPPDPELAARMLTNVADEGVRLLLLDPERYPAERLLAVAEWVLEGLVGGSGATASAAAGRSSGRR